MQSLPALAARSDPRQEDTLRLTVQLPAQSSAADSGWAFAGAQGCKLPPGGGFAHLRGKRFITSFPVADDSGRRTRILREEHDAISLAKWEAREDRWAHAFAVAKLFTHALVGSHACTALWLSVMCRLAASGSSLALGQSRAMLGPHLRMMTACQPCCS